MRNSAGKLSRSNPTTIPQFMQRYLPKPDRPSRRCCSPSQRVQERAPGTSGDSVAADDPVRSGASSRSMRAMVARRPPASARPRARRPHRLRRSPREGVATPTGRRSRRTRPRTRLKARLRSRPSTCVKRAQVCVCTEYVRPFLISHQPVRGGPGDWTMSVCARALPASSRDLERHASDGATASSSGRGLDGPVPAVPLAPGLPIEVAPPTVFNLRAPRADRRILALEGTASNSSAVGSDAAVHQEFSTSRRAHHECRSRAATIASAHGPRTILLTSMARRATDHRALRAHALSTTVTHLVDA